MQVLDSDMNRLGSYQKLWEARSSVRTRPRKPINLDDTRSFFPEEKQPILCADLSLKINQKVKEEILLLSLFRYLHDIIHIEIHSVAEACYHLMYDDQLAVNFSEEIKLNACTILIDEYYHIYIARDIIHQLDTKFLNLRKSISYSNPDAYNAITKIKEKLDSKYHAIFVIIAVSIFETTLIRELVEFFSAVNINPSIKYYVNDHMNDEARHYNFFYDLLCFTFANMPEDYKENIGSIIGDFIFLYLSMDSEKAFSLQILQKYFTEQCNPSEIVTKLYQGFEITQDIPIVKNVMKVLKSSKILDSRYVKDSFKKKGWNV